MDPPVISNRVVKRAAGDDTALRESKLCRISLDTTEPRGGFFIDSHVVMRFICLPEEEKNEKYEERDRPRDGDAERCCLRRKCGTRRSAATSRTYRATLNSLSRTRAYRTRSTCAAIRIEYLPAIGARDHWVPKGQRVLSGKPRGGVRGGSSQDGRDRPDRARRSDGGDTTRRPSASSCSGISRAGICSTCSTRRCSVPARRLSRPESEKARMTRALPCGPRGRGAVHCVMKRRLKRSRTCVPFPRVLGRHRLPRLRELMRSRPRASTTSRTRARRESTAADPARPSMPRT